MKSRPLPEVLLFDLGGVLVEWRGNEGLLDLTRGRIDPEEARKFWLESEAVRKFEVGGCSAEEFAALVVSSLRLTITPKEFLAQFKTWDKGPLPGAVDLLTQLWPKFRLACLSNNNELHWRRLKRFRGLLDSFHNTFASFEIKRIKPDREAFEFVLKALNVPGRNVMFFDDNIECVKTAINFGIEAYQTKGLDAVKKVLEERGILAAN